MKLTKKYAKKLIDGWEYINFYNKHNKNHKYISKEEYIDAFFQTIKSEKNLCIKCEECNKCES